MGRLLDKKFCSGCMACQNACPVKCISVKHDKNGFYMPEIDPSKCINCGLCEKICKKANRAGINTPMYGLAFTTNNLETLAKSSSGGAFTAISKMILEEGGVVYGAAYDENFCVKHIRADNLELLAKLNGSKYVQSDLNNCFESVKKDLKAGKQVLFSGTPCQVSGLVACLPLPLRSNLLTIDFICHGVPSPKAWNVYIDYLSNTVCGSIRSVNMRDHRISQESFGMHIVGDKNELFQSCTTDPFLAAFNNNLILRESCYRCKHKRLTCHSDITLGDLWGGKQLLAADRYIGHHSLVIANSAKGAIFMDKLTSYGTVDEISLKKSLTINSSRFYPSTKISGINIEDVIEQLGQGALQSKITKKERLTSRLKRKIMVLSKCLIISVNKKP